jgi:tyrosyl-tRNA synthetase
VSAEERDCIEETIEIILAELEEIQVRLQFHPEVPKKISESLKATAASRRSRVVHIFCVPAASSELTSLVVRVQEKLAEEAIRSIHSNSVVKVTKTDQEADFKKLKQEHNDTKRELAHLKQLCVKNQIDTSTRKQKEEQKGA